MSATPQDRKMVAAVIAFMEAATAGDGDQAGAAALRAVLADSEELERLVPVVLRVRQFLTEIHRPDWHQVASLIGALDDLLGAPSREPE